MPSPFPGMDPYLEQPAYWPDVHASLMFIFRTQMNAQLPEGFQAKIETELRIEGRRNRMRPDVAITVARNRPRETGNIAVAELVQSQNAVTPFYHLQFLSDSPPQRFIQISLVSDPSRIITIIEVLSPANKSRGRGFEDYREKQELLLDAPVNLLEIDLLREGEETVALPHRDDIPATPYIVTLHRAGKGSHFDTWPVSLREPLPRVAVPLTDEYPDLILDMQEALTQAYDLGGYWRGIEYRDDPAPPLAPEDAAWADSLLREKELRPG